MVSDSILKQRRQFGVELSLRANGSRECAPPLARNDGTPNFGYDFAASRRAAPESCKKPSARKRAWGMPDAQCTRGLVCNDSGRTHTSNNEYTGITRHSRTQWFYDLFRALP